MTNENTSNPKDPIPQENADGEEMLIKDPIYDIMTDEELEVASDRLTSLIEETEDEEKRT